MLRLKDLKQQGLHLTQLEAQEIHSAINGVSQGHNSTGVIFEKSVSQPIAEKPDLLKEYYAEIQIKNSQLLKDNDFLRDRVKELSEQNGDLNSRLAKTVTRIVINKDEPNISTIIDKLKGKPGRKSNK